MIIGHGLISTAFRKYYDTDPGVVVFASGVSNSRETRPGEFQRERRMLEEAVDGAPMLLYFSTCSIHDPELQQTPYVRHKQEMEALVATARRHAIFRLPQVVGLTPNPNTLTNYLHERISTGTPFQVWRHAKRNLIDVEDVASVVRFLMHDDWAQGRTMNVASPFYTSIPELVAVFEDVLGRKAECSEVDAGGSYPIDTTVAVEAARHCGVRFDEGYVRRLITKYYGNDAT